jgi:hypothetical protein
MCVFGALMCVCTGMQLFLIFLHYQRTILDKIIVPLTEQQD